MGIRTKNLQHETCHLASPGTLTAAANKDCIVIRFPGFISNVVGKVGSGGTGSTASVADIHLNGTTIFGTATKMTFAATTGLATYSPLASQPTPVAAGDQLVLDVDSIATAPANLNVMVTVTRTGIVAETNTTNLDDVL